MMGLESINCLHPLTILASKLQQLKGCKAFEQKGTCEHTGSIWFLCNFKEETDAKKNGLLIEILKKEMSNYC